MSNRNRDKGHRAEREIAQDLRNIGFLNCVTARAESKTLDDSGVDFAFTGCLAIQSKATEKQPNHQKLLKTIDRPGDYPVVVHTRSREGRVAVLRWEDFLEIVQTLLREGIWKEF